MQKKLHQTTGTPQVSGLKKYEGCQECAGSEHFILRCLQRNSFDVLFYKKKSAKVRLTVDENGNTVL